METPGRDKFEASPLATDGKLLMNFNSDVVVVDTKNGNVLNEIAMGDEEEALAGHHRRLGGAAIHPHQQETLLRRLSKLELIAQRG